VTIKLLRAVTEWASRKRSGTTSFALKFIVHRLAFIVSIMGHPVFLIGDAREVGQIQGQLQSVFLR
jgi:hypothetical protein